MHPIDRRNPLRVWVALLLLCLRVSVAAGQSEDFAIIVLPDPQHYASKYTKIGLAQMQWIRDNAEKLQIKFVSSVGDNVDSGYKEAQYKNSQSFFARLDDVVPYGIACGNHDLHDGTPGGYTCRNFVENYGPEHFRKYPWYGGASESGFSSWQQFSGGDHSFLVIHLTVNAPRPEIDWAKKVMADHPKLPVILVTHQLLTPKAALGKSLAARGPDRQTPVEIWDQLIKPSTQIFMVLCGHYNGEAYLAKKNQGGRPVHLILQDYQKEPKGGSGWLRILTFRPEKHQVQVQTFSPSLNGYKRENKSEFAFDLDLDHLAAPGKRAKTSQ